MTMPDLEYGYMRNAIDVVSRYARRRLSAQFRNVSVEMSVLA